MAESKEITINDIFASTPALDLENRIATLEELMANHSHDDRNTPALHATMYSQNFKSGSSGWQIKDNGDVEFNNGVFRGALSASTIDIGGSDASSFHVDVDGNLWSGAALFANGLFRVSNAGALYATGATIDGTSTIGGRLVSTVAAAIDAVGHFIDSTLNTSTQAILDGFKFSASGALNISATQTALTIAATIGATSITVTDTTGFPTSGVFYLQGNTNWMRITYTGKTGTTLTGIPASSTGSITEAAAIDNQVVGGPGILLTPKGLVTLNASGAETVTINGLTGDATFAGTLAAATGTLGVITSGSIYSGLFSTSNNGSTGSRMVISNSDNDLTFYNSSNAIVSQMGGGANILVAFRAILDSSTTIGVRVDSSTASDTGFEYRVTGNYVSKGINLQLTGATNGGYGININHDGNTGYGLYIDTSNGASGLYLNNTGIGSALTIASSSGTGIEISHTGDTTSGFYMEYGGRIEGMYLSGTDVNTAKSVLFVQGNAANQSTPIVLFQRDVPGMVQSIVTTASTAGPYIGIYFDIGGAGGGARNAFSFNGSEYVSAAVTGTQNRKIRVTIGGTTYYIPAYDA